MSQPLLIYTTWPEAESAHAFAVEAVAARLAACANILGPMVSVYRWEGAVEQAQETPMLLKTTGASVEALRALFLERHPYDTPAFVALQITGEASSPGYMDWLQTEVETASGAK
jgi:periplasmic divalent cation tolerance protein